MMDLQTWIDGLAHVLRIFSSEEYQERVWIRHEGPEVSWYDEAMCNFFDDYDVDRLVDVQWRQLGLPEEQRNKLAFFRDKINEFDSTMPESVEDDRIVVRNPKWPEVRMAASDALRSLDTWRSSIQF